MEYNDLYRVFKQEIPEGLNFLQTMEKENLIDETDGMHIIFGMIIVPYILYCIRHENVLEVRKIFSFLERMAVTEDVKVNEVLDFTVLEKLVDEGQDVIDKCKQYMGINTLKHCEEIEKYFLF